MNFVEDFKNSLISSKQSPTQKPEDFLGNIYQLEQECNEASPLFHLIAGGTITASTPFSFDSKGLNCYVLLYTLSGCGKLLVDNQVVTLVSPSLLLFDCHQRFRVDIAIEPWKYQVAFINGGNISYYFSMLPSQKYIRIPVLPYSEIALCLEKLLTQPKKPSPVCALTISNSINTILTFSIIDQLTENASTSSLPGYLTQIRDLFDTDFANNYSLNELEARFHVSKYRLCREFSSAFGISPLQYLNRRRIEMACHYLLTTDLKVHDIGTQVGIENTNHFISLFKKFTTFTPLEYRQRMST